MKTELSNAANPCAVLLRSYTTHSRQLRQAHMGCTQLWWEHKQAFKNIPPQADLKTDTISLCTKVQLRQKCPLWPRVLRSVHIRSAATCEIHHVTTRWACVSVSNVHLHCNMFIFVGFNILWVDSRARSVTNSSVKSHNLDKMFAVNRMHWRHQETQFEVMFWVHAYQLGLVGISSLYNISIYYLYTIWNEAIPFIWIYLAPVWYEHECNVTMLECNVIIPFLHIALTTWLH